MTRRGLLSRGRIAFDAEPDNENGLTRLGNRVIEKSVIVPPPKDDED